MGPDTWHGLVGRFFYHAGASGTPVIPAGSIILQIAAHASAGGATVTMAAGDGSGDAIPVVNGAPPLVLAFRHTGWRAAAANPLVFTSTDSYFVEYFREGHAV